MPITLNHSNIGVQYNTGSNYIIETVKSDLYLRNEIYDTIVSNNIQTAPVTPVVSIQEGSNVYAVESYTYSGTANTADFTRVFPKNTVCDILIVGGGGGGGSTHGGGGGAGQLVFIHQATLNGTYTIKVGKGGIGGSINATSQPTKGSNSEFGSVIAEGGGANGGNLLKDGGSGAGGDGYDNVSGKGLKNTTIDTFLSGTIYSKGNDGGSGPSSGIGHGGGGGGAGTAGTDGGIGQTTTGLTITGNGGDGLSGISEINYDFYTKFGNYGNLESDGKYYFAGGGGGGAWGNVSGTYTPNGGNGGKGGGSKGGIFDEPTITYNPLPALNNTGSGGGGGAPGGGAGSNGGSGIVIIRYLVGTIPSNNLLTTEPTVTPYVLVADAYYPRVPATNSATWIDNGYTVNVKVSDPLLYNQIYHLFNHIITTDDHYHSTQIYLNNGNTTYSGATSFKGNAGIAISIDIGRNIYPKRTRIAPRANHPQYGSQLTSAPGTFKIYASNNPSSWNDNNHIDWVLIHSQTSAATFVNSQYTIISLSNTPSISYRYYTMVVMTLAGNYSYLAFSEWSIGGDEKIDAISEGNPITHKRLNFVYEPKYPSISVDNTNLKAWYKFDGNYEDSSGSGFNLTNSGTVIVDGLIQNSVSFPNSASSLSTSGINLNSKTYSICFWAKLNTTLANSGVSDRWFWSQSISGGIGTFVGFQSLINSDKLRFTHYGSGNDMDTPAGMSALIGLNWNHYVITYNDTTKGGEIWINSVKLATSPATMSTRFTGSGDFKIGTSILNNINLNGLMEDFRYYDKVLTSTEISQLYNIPTQNTYTLNFPVPTIADINNNSNIVLRGAYDISLSTSNALIIPKSGQYIPKPTSFTNYSIERMYPPVRNFTAATTTVSGQTYGNGTYVVSFSSSTGGYEPWTCFNTSAPLGGYWAANRYTSGAFNSTSFIVAGYLGDWLKIQLPVAIKLTKFGFLARTDLDYEKLSPKDFKIYGSNDNITWVELVNKTDTVYYNASSIYEQTTPEITNAYTYYGLVVNKIFSDGYVLNFDEWYIYGQEVLPSSLSIRYNLLNPTLDPVGAQWTYNTSNMNVYNMGSVGVGTTNPEYHLDVSGSLNAKTLMYNGSSINSLGLSVGMIAQVQHLTYTKMELKDNTGWDAINENLTSGFVIKITPKSSLSKMLVNLIVFIGMSTSADNAWWGIKLYRKIGTGSWTEITGCNGTETGSAAATAGTPVWISNNTGMFSYNESITNASGTYLDSPNTTSTVYYTAYWNQRLGDNPSVTGQMFLNRASSQNDGYRPAPSSSWTVEEIWYG